MIQSSLNMIVPRVVRRGCGRSITTSGSLRQSIAPDAHAASQETTKGFNLRSYPASHGVPRKQAKNQASKEQPAEWIRWLHQSKLHMKINGSAYPVWLRDSCKCALCIDLSNKQKLFQTSDIPSDINISKGEVLPDESVKVTWSNDVPGYGESHISIYPKEFFEVNSKRKPVKYTAFGPHQYWDKALITKRIKFINFDQYMSQESALWDVLEQLRTFGLVFIRGVPASETSVEQIGSRIGTLRHTFYGRTWDVKSVPNAKNIAYTHQYLGLHMDLLYMDNPPYLQLLHCIKNSCEGGSSLFSDSFAAAQKLRLADEEAFQSLVRYPVPYHYDNAGEKYSSNRPIVTLQRGKGSSFSCVSWSPPFQGQYLLARSSEPQTLGDFKSHHAAMKKFAGHIEAAENVYEYRMEEGDCVIFNNRRVLHARRAFDVSSGERWLKGAYLDRDVYKSKWQVLQGAHGVPQGSATLPQTA